MVARFAPVRTDWSSADAQVSDESGEGLASWLRRSLFDWRIPPVADAGEGVLVIIVSPTLSPPTVDAMVTRPAS